MLVIKNDVREGDKLVDDALSAVQAQFRATYLLKPEAHPIDEYTVYGWQNQIHIRIKAARNTLITE